MHVPPELVPSPLHTAGSPRLPLRFLSSKQQPHALLPHQENANSRCSLGRAALAPRRMALGRRLALPVTIITKTDAGTSQH